MLDGMKSMAPHSLAASCTPRREFLRQLGLGAAFFTMPGAFAEELSRKTASLEEGPFYPHQLPLDTDNDLIIVNNSITPAVGQITYLSGRLLDASGGPIRNATIEIWEVDSLGVYLADRPRRTKYDANFQGFGRFLTGSTGEYYFRAIKPVSYPGRRAPHIHFKIRRKGQEPWNTQLFVKGEPGNEQDGIYRRIGDAQARASVTVDFVPLPGTRIGEVAARFDIILAAGSAS
jgi:protocatechuate 3,4-dioxygenase, beta subunit